jgi:hypothetical protein
MSEEQLLEKMGTTSEPNQLSPRILRRKEFSEATASIPMRRGSSTSDSHFKLVQQMKYPLLTLSCDSRNIIFKTKDVQQTVTLGEKRS